MNEDVNKSPILKKRRIEKLYKQSAMTLFGHSIEELSESEKKQLQLLNQAYGTSRAKMYSIKRNDGSDTFDHLLRVTYAILESKNPTILKELIAMNHDNIEDTDIDFNGLKNQYGTSDVALGVDLISKKPFCTFIKYSEDTESDYQIFENIKNTGILNDKGLVSDDFLNRKQNNEKITTEEENAYSEYKKLEKKYKNIRNETNFNHMDNFNTFYRHALRERDINNLRMTAEKVKYIVLEALEVKYWDRIDNLKTSEIYTEYNEETLKKARRKIKETERYFYKISKETHPYIHVLIKQEVERLRTYVIVEDMQKTKIKVNNILI